LSEKEFEAELTLKDRLNFPYLLANQILTFQKAILNLEYSEREIRDAIESFVHLIPQNWKDEKFEEELKAAIIKKQIDVRMEFCGVKPHLDYCKDNGIEPFKEQETFDYYKMFQACINLLDRKGMISKIITTDKITGVRYET